LQDIVFTNSQYVIMNARTDTFTHGCMAKNNDSDTGETTSYLEILTIKRQ